MLPFLLSCRDQLSIEEFHLLAFVLWQVWFYRNCKLHNRRCIPLVDIVPWCISSLAEYNAVNCKEPLQQVPLLVCWIPPNAGTVKVNIDDALDPLHGKTGLGAVICNHLGDALLVGFDIFDGVLVLDVVEVKAIFFGLSIAFQRGVTIHKLETDASTVISLLNIMF
ncbi:hypothetical protein ACOSQ3_027674 [Xanthoceras sorbifolium]